MAITSNKVFYLAICLFLSNYLAASNLGIEETLSSHSPSSHPSFSSPSSDIDFFEFALTHPETIRSSQKLRDRLLGLNFNWQVRIPFKKLPHLLPALTQEEFSASGLNALDERACQTLICYVRSKLQIPAFLKALFTLPLHQLSAPQAYLLETILYVHDVNFDDNLPNDLDPQILPEYGQYSCALGYAPAQTYIAMFEKNTETADKLFELSYNQGYKPAAFFWGQTLQMRSTSMIEENYSQEKRVYFLAKAIELLQNASKAASHLHSIAFL